MLGTSIGFPLIQYNAITENQVINDLGYLHVSNFYCMNLTIRQFILTHLHKNKEINSFNCMMLLFQK